MDTFERKTIVTRRSLKYTYYVSRHGESSKQHPTLFFIHGFPDSARLWADVVAQLGHLPNQIIIPNCLGYGGTDKPTDTKMYAYKHQVDDLAEILEAEKSQSTIVIGHDWGSVVAQRLYLYKRELISGVVLLNTGYMLPSDEPFDLAAVNELTKQAWGYPQFSYWEFFLGPDASEIIDANLERMWQVLHGDVKDWMKTLFCTPGAMRAFLLGDENVPLKAYAQRPEWKEHFLQQFRADGFESALQVYKATASNVQFESDLTIPKDRLAIQVPVLFVICSDDAVCQPEIMTPAKGLGLLPDFKEVVVEAAHWSPMEKPEEIAANIRDFVIERFASNKASK
ncbi:hypothetical protein AYO20_08747 [Fonsecaea nubica]|uniref:AB hydrolase-1 domain-containing protein n=1 Tax=Fonsecaea nubica TaxID=856822 RepID=A0A178CKS7_9EURO|nr:hypothetical protein AYO20_08747 [Fonsecaea nubica]OAL30528.1 hypothetical protein AYO20_08747 [Fonsecaea nubica]